MRAIQLLALASLFLLASCANHDASEPTVKVQKQDVAIAIHCDPKLDAEPVYPDTAANLATVPHPDAIYRLKVHPTDPAALTDEMDNLGYQLKLLLKGRIMRIQRDREKSAALTGCKGPPT